MNPQITELKAFRVLSLFTRLQEGQVVNKAEAAQEFCVTQRSVQRDIEDLRCFFAGQVPPKEVVYDAKAHGYLLTDAEPQMLNNSELLAVCKILLESRSMIKEEMLPILDRLITCCAPVQNRKMVSSLITSEKFHYVEPHHGQEILNKLWTVGTAVQQQFLMELTYERLKAPKLVTRLVKPVGIMFSEYYFYLTAFLCDVDREKEFENKDDLFPTIYRIDRIHALTVLDKHFSVPYKDRFEEGEFRKRVQFMFGGKLEKIKFKYTGPSIEVVLDRLPTAQIVERDGDGWTVTAEVFGKGIEMWLRSQGENLKIV